MTRFLHRVTRASRALLARARRHDDGFVLLESVVAISLITVIMAALATFFISTTASTSQQRARQMATQVATSAMETMRGLEHPSELVSGRGANSVATQFAGASATVQPWLASMDPASDPDAAASSGASATVPTVPVTQQVNNINYKLSTYLGWCSMASRTATDCTPSDSGVNLLRAVVAVEWPDRTCSAGTCTYITSALFSTTVDPSFSLNQSAPDAPEVDNPGSQTSMVGENVNLQLNVKAGTGVPTYTWLASGGSLPAGLSLDAEGLISGSPTSPVTNKSVTVQVTDGFTRTATATFTWTVLPRLVISAVADQGTVINTTISTLTLTATGGTGTGYTWTASNLPPGLSIATSSGKGQITGKPNTAGVYTVTITVKDSGNHTGTTTFTWTVAYPPLIVTNPGAQTSTVGTNVTLPLTASGGSGSYSWTNGGTLPLGLGLSGGQITGTPTTEGTWPVVLTVTDTKSGESKTVSFTWTVVRRSTIGTPPNQITTVGASVNVPVPSLCANAPCTYTLNNGPSGLSASSGGIAGTVGGSAPATYNNVSVTIRDAAGVTATSGTFTWTVNRAPVVTTPANQVVRTSTSVSLPITATYGTAPLIYSATGLPSWLTINPTTGVISGTSPATTSVTTGIVVRVTDAAGVTAASAAFKWSVTKLSIAIPDQVTERKGSVNLDLDDYVVGGTGPYTIQTSDITNKPTWLGYNATSHVLSDSQAPNQDSTTTGITVTVTDNNGDTATSAPFTWRVIKSTNVTWSAVPYQVSSPGVAVSLDIKPYVTGEAGSSTYSTTGLPQGVGINNGVISGTPTVPGRYVVTVSVTDSGGYAVPSQPFVWDVTTMRWQTIPNQATPSWQQDSLDLSGRFTGGVAPYTYSAAGLPSWMNLNASTGVISGRAPLIDFTTYSVAVTVTDGNGESVTTTFTWRVG